jgi:hypothetical protein
MIALATATSTSPTFKDLETEELPARRVAEVMLLSLLIAIADAMLSTAEGGLGGFSMSVVGLGGSLSQRKFSAIMLNWCDN